MKITHIEYVKLEMPLISPYTIAYETVKQAENIILKIICDNGLVGFGCAAPDRHVTGENCDDVISHIETDITSLLKNEFPFQIARHIHELKKVMPNAMSTIAMVDIALHDLLARQANLPLYQLLGGFKQAIPTSITIGIVPLKETLDEASFYLKKGFTIIKLKGGLSLDEDIEKIMMLRKRFGKDFNLRFDANQGYTPEQSIEFMQQIKPYDLEIFEQPTASKNEEELEKLTPDNGIPIMADESLKTLKQAYGLSQDDLTHLFNIKLMKMGGILESTQINSVAIAAGMEVMVGCLDECSLGIAAGLHFALSSKNIEYADLDGHLALNNDPFSNLLRLEQGVLYPSEGAGLGHIVF